MNIQTLATASLLAFAAFGANAGAPAYLETDARPRVWWHWMNGNITRDGIRKDLLWMKRAGIGGFTVFDAGMQTPQVVSHRLEYMSPEWRDALSYALTLADSLGLEVSIPSSPGWSLMGGPWVKPDDAMKKLTWRETEITGNGRPQTIRLPEPFATTGPFQNVRIQPNLLLSEVIPDDLPSAYRDIKVLAVRASSAPQPQIAPTLADGTPSAALTDGDLTTAVAVKYEPKSGIATLDIPLTEEATVSALSLCDGRQRLEFDAMPADIHSRLYARTAGRWQKVADIPAGGAPLQTITFEPVKTNSFRLEIDRPAPDYTLMMMGAPATPETEAKVSELHLYSGSRVNHAEEKAAFMASHDIDLYPTPSDAQGPAATDVIDLTDRLQPDGTLLWAAPKDRWTVIRFGWSLTGRRNHPASPEATGLETDKMDKEAWARYFDRYLAMYGVGGAKAIKYILTDSYESGTSTWTARMADEFRARRGYDLTPYMPVLAGHVIGSGSESDRFLWDWRKTIAELHAECYDTLTTIARNHGLEGRYTESHEHGRLYVADGMDVKRTSAVPMAALWARSADGKPVSDTMAEADMRESASVAHIYGQKAVALESFTVVGFPNNAWTFSPETLKPYADFAFACGVNRIVVHTSPHQPADSLRPGLSLTAVGQWFDRHETWAELARPWTDWLTHTSALLQSGIHCADILYLYGEDNCISALFGHTPPAIPSGYDFDYCNATALTTGAVAPMTERAADNSLTATLHAPASGCTWRVLQLDRSTSRMSLGLLRTIARLAEAGVAICGPMPQYCASLADDEAEFKALAWRVWHDSRHPVYKDAAEALAAIGLQPDCYLTSTATAAPRYVHRRLPEGDIYWISNPADTCATISIATRAGQKETITLPAHGTYEVGTAAAAPDMPAVATLRPAHWRITFSPAAGPAPAPTVTDALFPLDKSDNDTIRHFSGSATYAASVTVKRIKRGSRLTLRLGEVKNIAVVRVNGQVVDTLWKAPFETDITACARRGANRIEIAVTNLWPNRLIGDCQPGAVPSTFTALPFYRPDAPLLPSGLIGPVELTVSEPE